MVAATQSLVFDERPEKASSLNDDIPRGEILLVFESKLDLIFESSSEKIAPPVRTANLYKVLLEKKKCVITVTDTASAERAYLQFGQLTNSEFNFPPLKKGERKYYKVRQVTNLHFFDITEQEKQKVTDNQMNSEKEALLIFIFEPVEMKLEFTTTQTITEVKNEKGRCRLFVTPTDQIITIKTQGLDDTPIVVNGLTKKAVKYYFLSLPYSKARKDDQLASKSNRYPEAITNGTATVNTTPCYFYQQPDISSKTSSFVIDGQRVKYSKESGRFIYGSYPNKGAKMEGWLLKANFKEFSGSENSLAKTATATVNRAFFYQKPDEISKTKKYIIIRQEVEYYKEEGDFIYAFFFTGGNAAKTEGWMLKSDFREFFKIAIANVPVAYFYHDSDISTRRTAYVTAGQEVKYYKEEGGFIYATFFDRGGAIKTEGWMLKSQFKLQ